jgi:hypothetical protein
MHERLAVMLGDAAEQRQDLNPLIDPESFVILASEFNHPSVSALKPPIAWNVAAFNRPSRAPWTSPGSVQITLSTKPGELQTLTTRELVRRRSRARAA